MHVWGRAEGSGKWPSRFPVASLGAVVLAVAAGMGIFVFSMAAVWTPLQRYYWGQYTASEMFRGQGNFRLLAAVDRRGQHRLDIDADVVPVITPNQQPGQRQVIPFALSAQGRQRGAVGLTIDPARYESTRAHQILAECF